jgi:hypothetical protein
MLNARAHDLIMAHAATAAEQEMLTSVPVANWSDGSTVRSVVVPDTDEVQHEYWVVRAGQVLAKLPSLAAVDEWRLH